MCLQNPVPYIFWNFFVQLLQQPDKVTLVYAHDSDFRTARLNQPHPAKVTPSLHGDSVGHYEGDTLVIDTVGVKLGPYRMIDRFGTPYSRALHVVERYRLIDYETTGSARAGREEWPRAGGAVDPHLPGRGPAARIHGGGPRRFYHALVGDHHLWPQRDPWEERVCAENVQHDYQLSQFSDKDAHLPTADKPDFVVGPGTASTRRARGQLGSAPPQHRQEQDRRDRHPGEHDG